MFDVHEIWPYRLSAFSMNQLDSISDQKYQGSPSFLLFEVLTYLHEEYISSFQVILIVKLFYRKAALSFLQATSFIRIFNIKLIEVDRFHDQAQESYHTYVFLFLF